MANMDFKNILKCIFLTLIQLSYIGCRDKTIISRNIISNFKIGYYEFEVINVIEIDRKTKEIIREFNDTILINLCELYEDFKDCEDDSY